MKKDIKKSSYYVWFLGAEEAKGLRGSDYMIPVIRHLVERERATEPFKVTLQVSHKGLKIMQNVPVGYPTTKISKSGKTEVIKHFIPHHSITSVYQEEDIVSCILLLFNPVTKCPVHVHAYRCDSIETAEILSGQLHTLTERPENQKKLEEIESRLKAKGLVQSAQCKLRKVHSPASGSSDRSSARESDLSGGSSNSDRLSGESRIANLYDSLAAELKEKLCTGSQQNHAPILLPPRDYDTVHRQKGNLSGIDFRRCLNMNIVGMNGAKNKKNEFISAQTPAGKKHSASPRTKVGSSGGSSGIGSDHAPSPDQETDARYLDNQSSSDEDWNAEPNEDSLFLVQSSNSWPSKDLSLPRARRHNSSGFDSSPLTSASSANSPPDHRYVQENSGGDYRSRKPVRSVPSCDLDLQQKYLDEVRVPKQPSFFDKGASKSEMKLESCKKRSAEERQRSPSPNEVTSPKERFKDAKEKFLLLERERLEEQEKQLQQNVEKRKSHEYNSSKSSLTSKGWSREDEARRGYRHAGDYCGDDDFDFVEKCRPTAHRIPYHRNKSVESLNCEEYPAVVGPGHRTHDASVHMSRSKLNSFRGEDDRFIDNRMSRYCSQEMDPKKTGGRRSGCRSPVNNATPRPTGRSYSEDYLPDHVEPKRYRDMSRSQHLVPFANDKSIPLRRYRSPSRHEENNRLPRNPYPSCSEEENHQRRLKRSDSKYHSKVNEMDKRRSMLDNIEDEKRRNSNEIAKEFKRRSYQDNRTGSEISYQGSLGYHEINEQDRYPAAADREVWTNRNKLIKNGKAAGNAIPAASPRYRHSYAEPFHHAPPINHHHEILQRANSSLSSGRIGIAAIHHY